MKLLDINSINNIYIFWGGGGGVGGVGVGVWGWGLVLYGFDSFDLFGYTY